MLDLQSLLPAGYFPNTDLQVPGRRRQQLPIRREGDRGQSAAATDLSNFMSSHRIPQAGYPLVIASCDTKAISGKGGRGQPPAVTIKSQPRIAVDLP